MKLAIDHPERVERLVLLDSLPFFAAAALMPGMTTESVKLMVVAMLRVLVNLDELQRLIQLHAFAFSALLTALITAVFGLLEGVVIARVSIWIVWPMIIGLWWLGMGIFSWHYRHASHE